MIVREYYATRKDRVKLYKSYSDSNFYIIQQPTGIEYDIAIDVEHAPYTYIESDRLIEVEEVEENNVEKTID